MESYPSDRPTILIGESAPVVSRTELAFSVALIPAAVVVGAVVGWLALRVNIYWVVAFAIPMALIALSCLGLRGLRDSLSHGH